MFAARNESVVTTDTKTSSATYVHVLAQCTHIQYYTRYIYSITISRNMHLYHPNLLITSLLVLYMHGCADSCAKIHVHPYTILHTYIPTHPKHTSLQLSYTHTIILAKLTTLCFSASINLSISSIEVLCSASNWTRKI